MKMASVVLDYYQMREVKAEINSTDTSGVPSQDMIQNMICEMS
jgi:hypothetical protein